MDIPESYRFTDEHEWARHNDDGTITVGVSWHAQDLLGDIVYIELPDEGETIGVGEEFGVVESVKAASDLYSPVSGEVVEVNDELMDAPESINEDPFERGWMMRIDPGDQDELGDLMDAEDYASFVAED